MRNVWCLFALLVALAAPLYGQETMQVTVADKGNPIAGVEGFVYDGGELKSAGATNQNGQLKFPASLASLLRVKTNVVVAECPDGNSIAFVDESESEDACTLLKSRDDECKKKCRLLAWLPGKTVALEKGFPVVYAGLGAGAGGAVLLATLGGDSTPAPPPPTPGPIASAPDELTPVFTAEGSYLISLIQIIEGNPEHEPFILLLRLIGGILNASEGSISVSGPEPWVTVTGPFDNQTGAFNATGSGTVAGFRNVGVAFEGTISATGRMTGRYTMGTGGELPGGRSITYSVEAQRQ